MLHGGCALSLTMWIMLPGRGKVCTRISLPCINSEIWKAINKRYKLPRACDGSPLTTNTWAGYKHARNEVTRLLRNAEALHWKERFAESNVGKNLAEKSLQSRAAYL